MRAKQDEECQQLHEAIEYTNERQRQLLAMMERKQKSPENLWRMIFQEIRVLDERISAEDFDLLEKKQAMKGLLKERRCTEVEEWRDTVVGGSGVTRVVAALGLEAPNRRVIPFSPKWEFNKVWRKIRDPLAKSRRRQRKEEQ